MTGEFRGSAQGFGKQPGRRFGKPGGAAERSGQPQRRGGVSPFGDVLKGFLRESGLGSHLSRAAITKAWRDACGPELARRTRVVGFKNGELVVEVESAAHFQELKAFRGDECVQAANQILRAPRIRRASFRLKR